MKTKLLLIIGIALSISIIYFALNSTNHTKHYEFFPIELKVAEKLHDGSVWHFSGFVYDSDTKITMSVRDPTGNIITTNAIMANEYGNFDIQITTVGPLWDKDGKYLLILEQGEFTEVQTFRVN